VDDVAPRGGAGMAEVFISYSQKDRAIVAPIATRLVELGIDAWYDREISAGQSFGAIIRARLREAKAIIVCWSTEAIESQWVDSEADFAREMGTYVPIFVTPCALMPPFNRIHTDDLSKWAGAANDPIWIKLVDRLAHLIGREGIAAAARAMATEDEHARYDFARRYPDEPVARKIWAAAEARHRQEFEKRLAEARAAGAAKIKTERATLDARLAGAAPAFEAWLSDERRGAAKAPRPDPLGVIDAAGGDEAQHLRNEIAALSGALAQAEAREVELDTAREKIELLSGELTAARATAAAPAARSQPRVRGWALAAGIGIFAALAMELIRQVTLPSSGGEAAKLQAEIDPANKAAAEARDRAAKLQADLAASQSQAQTAAAELDKLRAAATAQDTKLSDAASALAAANDRATKLQTDLAASQSQAQLAAADLDKLRATASVQDKKLSDAASALAAADNRATKLQADLAASQSRAQLAAADLDNLQAAARAQDKKLSDATSALAAANDRATELQANLAASQSQAQLAAADLDKLRAAASVQDKKLSDATSALAAANDEASELQGDLAASQSEALVAAAEADKLRAKTSGEEKKFSDASAALAEAENRASKLQDDLVASRSQDQLTVKELDKLRAAASARDRKLSDATDAVAEADVRETKLRADLAASQSQARDEAAELDKLREVASAQDQKLSAATDALDAANERAEKLQTDLDASKPNPLPAPTPSASPSSEPQPATQSQLLSDGIHRGTRGWTQTSSDATGCGTYTFDVTINGNSITFDSDNNTWSGTIDQTTGYVDMSTPTEPDLYIRGNYQNAEMGGGKVCILGFFKIY
jgi:hypothetical protein